MNFIVTENQEHLVSNKGEVVIIYVDINNSMKHIYCNFPSHRFVDQKNKIKTFMERINGTLQEDGAILTGESSYKIYEVFYNTFY